ncbi:MAG: MBL fold metallo-hydrolase [Pseudomonadota bacterium]|nr:MBL fold metallo-hydrolase [Pseudomonadota bacterium]
MKWAAAFLLPLAVATSAVAIAIELQPIQVTPRVFYVQGKPGIASAENEGFNSNAGFVVTDEGVVVIDALGTLALGEALVDAIRKVTPKPIKRVIVTHYHADHFYGLEPLKKAGAEILAHRAALQYLDSGEGARRLEQRARDLFPRVSDTMSLVRADRWLDADERFEMGGVRFEVVPMGPAHSPEDLIVVVPGEGVIFSGDILFAGRIPFVGEADSKRWLERIGTLLALEPVLMVTGHGQVSRDPRRDLALTRDYLLYLRATMGKAVEELTPFDEAYAKVDWSRFSKVPAFDVANRINAYGTYILMEREALSR